MSKSVGRGSRGEGFIYKRKDGRWCGKYTDANGKTRYVYAKTEAEVRTKLTMYSRRNILCLQHRIAKLEGVERSCPECEVGPARVHVAWGRSSGMLEYAGIENSPAEPCPECGDTPEVVRVTRVPNESLRLPPRRSWSSRTDR
jgi:hypothetical protein